MFCWTNSCESVGAPVDVHQPPVWPGWRWEPPGCAASPGRSACRPAVWPAPRRSARSGFRRTQQTLRACYRPRLLHPAWAPEIQRWTQETLSLQGGKKINEQQTSSRVIIQALTQQDLLVAVWIMTQLQLIISRRHDRCEIFAVSLECYRLLESPAPTSSSSGQWALTHLCMWPLPLGHRPAAIAIFPSTPHHLRWVIKLQLLHLLHRGLALPFLQIIQQVLTIWDLEKWREISHVLQPQDRGGSSWVFSCLILSKLVHRVAVDFAVWVAGQVAGARHICRVRGVKWVGGVVNNRGHQL